MSALPAQPSLPPPASTVRIYGTVLSVGIVCALAIVSVYETTRPLIVRQRQQQLRQAVLDVLPGAESMIPFEYLGGQGGFQQAAQDATGPNLVYAGFDAQGDLIGIAKEARGMGYQDQIRLIYGVSVADQTVVGMRVLESRETPGLGDRIETDAGFQNNFLHLEVRLNAQGRELAHRIAYVAAGKKQEAWQIDGLSGATISSRAVADILAESTWLWVPRCLAQTEHFQIETKGKP